MGIFKLVIPFRQTKDTAEKSKYVLNAVKSLFFPK